VRTYLGVETFIHQYIYENGRLVRIEHHTDSEPESPPSQYLYDEAGRLTRINSNSFDNGCDKDLYRCESYAYGAGGQLSKFQWHTGFYASVGSLDYTETYDDAGRVLTTHRSGYNSEDPWEEDSERQYDEAGRLSSVRWMNGGWDYDDVFLIRYEYGDQDQRLLEWSVNESTPGPAYTTRSTYICGTSRLYLKEFDEDGDGTVDARCTYDRDAAGRLLKEQCESMKDPFTIRSVTEYSYDCEPL
jgi:hypothetical protein